MFRNELAKNGMKYSLIIMIVCYGFRYANPFFLADNMFFYRGNVNHVISTDKWTWLVYDYLDGALAMPWLSGMFSIAIMCVSVGIMIEILNLRTKIAAGLIAGFFCTQSSMICAQADCSYEMPLALFFACLACLFIRKANGRSWMYIFGICFEALSAGTYGAYVSMVSSVLIILLIFDVFKYREKYNFKNALVYFSLFSLGIVLYYAIWRMLVKITGGIITTYMNENTLTEVDGLLQKVYYIVPAYKTIIKYYTGQLHYLPNFLNKNLLILLIITVGLFVKKIIVEGKNLSKWNILLLACLILILPISVNMIYVLSSGLVHYYMVFTYITLLIILTKLIDDLDYQVSLEKICTVIGGGISIVFIFYSIIMANAMIFHLQHLAIESNAIATNMLGRIELTEGFTGEEDIVVLGTMQHNEYYKRTLEKDAPILTEVEYPLFAMKNGIEDGSWISAYMRNVLNSKMNFYMYYEVENQLSDNEKLIAIEMECYPKVRSIEKVNDKIFIKLSNE